MMLVVALVIVGLSILLGAEQGPKVDPTTTTYTPRPEWYFFFLFELLRVIKPPWAVPIATIGLPTLFMVLLLLLPFYDRNAERRPERRPIATTAGILTIIGMAYLTFLGATAGPPTQIDLKTSAALEPGKEVVAQSGCLACHKLGDNGNDGPGPELTQIGARIPQKRDRALAAGRPEHHAVLRRAPAGEVPGADGVSRLPELAARRAVLISLDECLVQHRGRERHPPAGFGGVRHGGPWHVRPDSGRLRPDELGDDRRAAS